jgi:hypothetical protein
MYAKILSHENGRQLFVDTITLTQAKGLLPSLDVHCSVDIHELLMRDEKIKFKIQARHVVPECLNLLITSMVHQNFVLGN